MHLNMRSSRLCFSKFRENFNLKQKFTLRGAMRRFERRNPRATQFIKFSSVFLLLSSFSYLLLPGTSLPFQNEIKKQVYLKYISIYKWWFMDQDINNKQNYIKYVLEVLVKAINEGIDDWQWILSTMQNTVDQNQFKQQLQKNSQIEMKETNSAVPLIKQQKNLNNLSIECRLNIIMYSNIILTSLIKYQWKTLKNAKTYNLYYNIFKQHCIGVLQQLSKKPKIYFSKTENLQLELSLNILLYLINFHELGQQGSKFKNLVRECSDITYMENIDFYWLLMLNHQQLLRSFKKIYSESKDQQLKKDILTIFNKLDGVYKEKNKQVKGQY